MFFTPRRLLRNIHGKVIKMIFLIEKIWCATNIFKCISLSPQIQTKLRNYLLEQIPSVPQRNSSFHVPWIRSSFEWNQRKFVCLYQLDTSTDLDTSIQSEQKNAYRAKRALPEGIGLLRGKQIHPLPTYIKLASVSARLTFRILSFKSLWKPKKILHTQKMSVARFCKEWGY